MSASLHPSPRGGFTLLEMLVVIAIIGILAAFIIPDLTGSTESAHILACKQNMKQLHGFLIRWGSAHNQALPKDEGQRFFLRVWKDGTVERSKANAKRFFCPQVGFEDFVPPDGGVGVEEYLSDWDAVGEGYTSYAGFDPGGDATLRRKLSTDPSKVTILADAGRNHRNTIVYMTGDGELHALNLTHLVDAGILTQQQVDDFDIPLGPGSPISELRTVSNR